MRDQEDRIFGATAGGSGVASSLIVRTRQWVFSNAIKDADQLEAPVNSPEGYLLFPLRSNSKKGVNAARGVFTKDKLPDFDLELVWRGSADYWNDVRALACIFGHLGSLGFRSRRAMGALAFREQAPDLKVALMRFAQPSNITIRCLPASDASESVKSLAVWLRKWRSYGRSPNNLNSFNAGLEFAKNDHDIGYNMPGTQASGAFRPALGLPIIQRTQNGTNNWEWDWNKQKKKPKGRFASPVILRPHRDAQGKWYALVIFVDAYKWPDGHLVYLNGQPRNVSLDLYEAMKSDPDLKPFP